MGIQRFTNHFNWGGSLIINSRSHLGNVYSNWLSLRNEQDEQGLSILPTYQRTTSDMGVSNYQPVRVWVLSLLQICMFFRILFEQAGFLILFVLFILPFFSQ